MHKLQRGNAPAGLSNYRHGKDNWGALSPDDKTAIWRELDAMQGQRCAYCESDIADGNKHIEHFRQKDPNPTTTFLWSNLFGSCNREESCGRHKDRRISYLPTDLLKPDEDDPEHYLVFAADGSVSPRKNLSPVDLRRATETLRIFNLNGVLRHIRFREVAGYVQTAEEIAELANDYPESEWLPLLQDELAKISHLPFATAIKHVLTRQT